MSQDAFDDIQLSAMTRTIDEIMESEATDLKRSEVAHAVFIMARESGNYDAIELARMARKRLAAGRGSE
jgi:hypothetical protein